MVEAEEGILLGELNTVESLLAWLGSELEAGGMRLDWTIRAISTPSEGTTREASTQTEVSRTRNDIRGCKSHCAL